MIEQIDEALFSNFPIVIDRFKKEYENIEYLGGGAFGTVYKVKHRVDKKSYAIKKVLLMDVGDSEELRRIRREIMYLSQLSHKNIVRYYNSWLEKKSETLLTDTNSNCSNKSSMRMEFINVTADDIKSWSTEIKKDDIEQRKSESDVDDEGEDRDDDIGCGVEDDDDSANDFHPSYLYIAMELCSNSTLRQLINETELYKNRDRCWNISIGIVQGLAYIHQQKIIHRDLKPENILFDALDTAKIGDFGLAVDCGSNVFQTATVSEQCTHLTSNVGTQLYAAPEITSKNYNEVQTNKDSLRRVDVYSLGIILTEIFYPAFTTESERIKVLEKLRSSIEFPADFPTIAKFNDNQLAYLRQLLNHKAMKRPDAKDVLGSEFWPSDQKGKIIMQMLSDESSKLNDRRQDLTSMLIQNFEPSIADDYEVNEHPRNSCQILEQLCIANQLKTQFHTQLRQLHFVDFQTPLFLEKRRAASSDITVVMIDSNSNAVHLPSNLHDGFLRYVQQNHVVSMKRYTISNTYRYLTSKRMNHPKQATVCALDIVKCVNPFRSNEAVSELLADVGEMLKSNKQWEKQAVRIGHVSFIKTVLICFGVRDVDNQSKLYDSLNDLWLNKITQKRWLTFVLKQFALNKDQALELQQIMEMSTTAEVQKYFFEHQDRENVTVFYIVMDFLSNTLATIKDVELSMRLFFNLSDYDGIVFNIFYKSRKKNVRSLNNVVLAEGGAYPKHSLELGRAVNVAGANIHFGTLVRLMIKTCKSKIYCYFNYSNQTDRTRLTDILEKCFFPISRCKIYNFDPKTEINEAKKILIDLGFLIPSSFVHVLFINCPIIEYVEVITFFQHEKINSTVMKIDELKKFLTKNFI